MMKCRPKYARRESPIDACRETKFAQLLSRNLRSLAQLKNSVGFDSSGSTYNSSNSAVEGETMGKAQAFRCEGKGSVPLRNCKQRCVSRGVKS